MTAICALLLEVACGGGSGGTSNPPSPPVLYTVGVSVSGLTGSGLVLQLNSSDSLPVMASGIDTFTSSLASGTSYAVTVLTQPSSPAQTCSVTNGTGTIVGSNITHVAIACVATAPKSHWAGRAGVVSPVVGIPDGTLGSDLIVSNLRCDAAGNLYVFGLEPDGGQSLLRLAPAMGGFAAPMTENLVSPVFPAGFESPMVAGFAVH